MSEAHHATSEDYVRVLQHWGLLVRIRDSIVEQLNRAVKQAADEVARVEQERCP